MNFKIQAFCDICNKWEDVVSIPTDRSYIKMRCGYQPVIMNKEDIEAIRHIMFDMKINSRRK